MRDSKEYTIFSAQASTGTGKVLNVQDFRHVCLFIGTASSGNLTVKIQGSISETAPDFTAAQSATNRWDYVQLKDLEDQASVDGDTGFAVAGTDDFRNFEVNTNGLRWLTATVTARAAGSVTVIARTFED